MLTEREQRYCIEIHERIDSLRSYLRENHLPSPDGSIEEWYKLVSGIKRIQGNLNNDISFIATLLAKAYLKNRFPSIVLDAAEKAQGAPGLDIDVELDGGVRIVGEIKTTIPYQGNDFGAQQRKAFEKDFSKLVGSDANHKFMFVTEQSTYDILVKSSYQFLMPGVEVVNLVSGISVRAQDGKVAFSKQSKNYKYEALEVFLKGEKSDKSEISLSFGEIEKVLGFRLPASAYKYREWWANQSDTSTRPQARAWLRAGFKVEGFKQSVNSGWVRFRRIGS